MDLGWAMKERVKAHSLIFNLTKWKTGVSIYGDKEDHGKNRFMGVRSLILHIFSLRCS